MKTGLSHQPDSTVKFADRLSEWIGQQALMVVDIEGRICEATEAFAQQVGRPLLKLQGQFFVDLFEAQNPVVLRQQIAHELQHTGFWQGILALQQQAQLLQVNLYALSNGSSPHFVGILYPVQAESVFSQREQLRRAEARLAAVERVMASIEFDLSGHIRTANANFLATMGYTLEEIRGQHHRIFMFPEDAAKPEYAQLWAKLHEGQPQVGIFRRRSRKGAEIWILGSYNPILDEAGRPISLIKYAFDVTDHRQSYNRLNQLLEKIQVVNDELERTRAELASQLSAISRSTAVIEFDLSGYIQTANANFLAATGYSLEEIRGQHHRIFMFPEDAAKPEYDQLWASIRAGEFVTGTFRRRTKDGREIWILGSYNPILGSDGLPTRVVKYVTDVTKQVQQERRMHEALESLATAEEELRMNLEEMQAMNEELENQRRTSDRLLTDVRESIRYAQRIQTAIIPTETQLNTLLPPNYRAGVFFQPRDLVSGDFYWIGRWGRRAVLAVGDSTGHGVPGSFVSLIGMTVLQKLVERGVTDPVVLLEELDAEIQRVLGQQGVGSLQDSIELAICTLDERTGTVLLASAMRPVWHVGTDRWVEIPTSRYPVGGNQHGDKFFQLRLLELQPGETLYLFSDGLQDQFGTNGDLSAKPRKWGRKALQEHLLRLHERPLPERMPALEVEYNRWRGHQPQTDDILCLALEYRG